MSLSAPLAEIEQLMGNRHYVLSPREADVLGLYAKGLPATEVARRLSVSPHTVRTHLYHVYQKMGFQNGYHSGVLAAYRTVRNGQLSVPHMLTDREQAVCSYALAGLSNGQIAGMLRITTSTVKTHMEHILQKLGVHSRRALIDAMSRTPPEAGNVY